MGARCIAQAEEEASAGRLLDVSDELQSLGLGGRMGETSFDWSLWACDQVPMLASAIDRCRVGLGVRRH